MFVLQVMSAAMEFVPLVCLSLVTWSGITSADGPTVVQQVVEEDGDAVLSCSFGKNIKGTIFDWRKDGDTEVFMYDKDGRPLRLGPSFIGRVSHFPEALQSGNASIVIRGTKVSDSGIYTCDFPKDPPERRSTISLTVEQILKDRSAEKIPGASPKPSFKILDQKQGHAALQCDVEGAFPKPQVVWKNSAGDVLPADEHVTNKNGKYHVSLQTNVTETDNYRCVSTQEDLGHEMYIGTYLHISGAVKPHIETVEQTNEWALLQCEVHGVSPKTKLQWKDSFQNVVPAKDPEVRERGGSYDIILQTTVTKSDYYHCVATQEETGLQTEVKIFVNIGGSSSAVVAGISSAVTAAVCILIGVILFCVFKSRGVSQSDSIKGGSNEPKNSAANQGLLSSHVTPEPAGTCSMSDSPGSV